MAGSRTTLTDEEAETLFEETKSRDPLPFVPPALLNSADIHEYVVRTGMVAPYDTKYLKSSSYEVQIGDEIIYWDDSGKKYHLESVADGTEVILKPNSLMFFKTKQKFRLPDYIAVRFNLRITNVHRGLLLGTGPLVDPGFEGHILIPLHNLTTNFYAFKTGESLIWVEFTKTSPNLRWQDLINNEYRYFKTFVEFDRKKINIKPKAYLAKASPHSPIRNAVPDAIGSAKESAESAEKTVRWIQRAGIGAILLTLVLSFFGLIQPILSMIEDTNYYLQSINAERRDYEAMSERLEALEAEIRQMRNAREIEAEPANNATNPQ